MSEQKSPEDIAANPAEAKQESLVRVIVPKVSKFTPLNELSSGSIPINALQDLVHQFSGVRKIFSKQGGKSQ